MNPDLQRLIAEVEAALSARSDRVRDWIGYSERALDARRREKLNRLWQSLSQRRLHQAFYFHCNFSSVLPRDPVVFCRFQGQNIAKITAREESFFFSTADYEADTRKYLAHGMKVWAGKTV